MTYVLVACGSFRGDSDLVGDIDAKSFATVIDSTERGPSMPWFDEEAADAALGGLTDSSGSCTNEVVLCTLGDPVELTEVGAVTPC